MDPHSGALGRQIGFHKPLKSESKGQIIMEDMKSRRKDREVLEMGGSNVIKMH